MHKGGNVAERHRKCEFDQKKKRVRFVCYDVLDFFFSAKDVGAFCWREKVDHRGADKHVAPMTSGV